MVGTPFNVNMVSTIDDLGRFFIVLEFPFSHHEIPKK
jgi:hypothetical protein